jgi:hypothetical protein
MPSLELNIICLQKYSCVSFRTTTCHESGIVSDDLGHSCLECIAAAVSEQFITTASLIKEVCGWRLSFIL